MNKKSVLLVDDDVQILRALKREFDGLFRELELIPRIFQDPREALDFMTNDREGTAVLISDQKMPEMSGSDLIARATALDRDIVSILLTAYSDIDAVIASVRSGISAFVLKPWKGEDLSEEIRKAHGLHRRMREQKMRESHLQMDLRQSGQLQKKYLQSALPCNDRIRITAGSLPLMPCGGDFYDAITLDGDNYLVIIGDVAGHGVNAAFITFIIKTLLNDTAFRSLLHRNLSVSSLVSWLNIRLIRELENIQPILVSLCMAHFDLKKMRMSLCSAGHMPPFLLRKDRITRLEAPGTALCFSEDVPYSEKHYSLKKDDRIVLYTDGVSEIENRGRSLEEILSFRKGNRYFASVVLEDVKSLLTAELFADDMTLLSVEVLQ